jgi:hypothetical protein
VFVCVGEGLWFLFLREVAGIHSLSALNSLLWRRREREREQITINRPERRNAFRPLTVMELKRAFDYARDDPEVGVVIFTGKVLAKSCSSFPILHSLLQSSPLSLCLSDPLSLFLSLSLSFVLDNAVSQSVSHRSAAAQYSSFLFSFFWLQVSLGQDTHTQKKTKNKKQDFFVENP